MIFDETERFVAWLHRNPKLRYEIMKAVHQAEEELRVVKMLVEISREQPLTETQKQVVNDWKELMEVI